VVINGLHSKKGHLWQTNILKVEGREIEVGGKREVPPVGKKIAKKHLALRVQEL